MIDAGIRRRLPLAVAPVAVVAALAGCTSVSSADVGEGNTVEVTATDESCELSTHNVQAGAVELSITNEGSKATEVEVLRQDRSIVSERENIGPGISSDLVVKLPADTYTIWCRPGMTGEGSTAKLTATGQSKEAESQDPQVKAAVSAYRDYVAKQVDLTLRRTKKFVAAVKSGNLSKAKALYAPSRVGWERIEPVAESFGDIDPKVDLREADLAKGDKWTGWHRMEKTLFAKDTTKGLAKYGDQLLADLRDLRSRVPDAQITATSMANGAKELLDEVATSKVTGEEEVFSHTDLVDFQANLDGARKVFELLKPIVTDTNPDLAKKLQANFTTVQDRLNQYRTKDGFVDYSTVGKKQRQELADAVAGLAEPLSHLAAAVIKS